jgi:fatty-acyl-CoA synthase
MNLGRLSTYWGKYRSGQPALVYKGAVLTWGELDRQVDAVAAALQQLGVAKGDRVSCLLNNCTEWAVAYLAAMKAGAILVPLNARYGEDELREIEKQVSSRGVVSQPALVRKLGGADFSGEEGAGIHLYAMEQRTAISWEAALRAGGRPAAVEVKPEDAAVICFTSGSTGLPKGVVHTHQGILGFAQSHITALGWTSQEKVVMLAPFAFTGGIISTFTPAFAVGACTYIEEGFDPHRALQMLVNERITSLTGVPIFWERMAACPGFAEADLSSLRSAVTGGAPVASSLLQTYSAKGISIRQSYGCTEGCGMLALPTAEGALSKPWSCGWPLASVDLQVVGDDGAPCAAGEAGEILIRGIQVMKGYWNNPQADRQAWSKGWYHTGDMGVLDEQGHLQIVDRKKSMIISGGVNVYPAEVERALAQLPGLAEVLVFGQPDAQWGERVVAVLYGPQLAEPLSLLKECRRLAGDYKAPREIIVSPRPLPRTSTGKLPRKDLAQLYAGLDGCPRAVAGDEKRA